MGATDAGGAEWSAALGAIGLTQQIGRGDERSAIPASSQNADDAMRDGRRSGVCVDVGNLPE